MMTRVLAAFLAPSPQPRPRRSAQSPSLSYTYCPRMVDAVVMFLALSPRHSFIRSLFLRVLHHSIPHLGRVANHTVGPVSQPIHGCNVPAASRMFIQKDYWRWYDANDPYALHSLNIRLISSATYCGKGQHNFLGLQ
ncbi:hypothetical protein EV363DRAFT_1169355 [Boletus edulis]|nr:hypothetical protein EV363DRAFT_1169355 [Boletus edulis]